MTPEQIAEKHFPFNTTCPAKKKKIIWQREQLVIDLHLFYLSFQERISLEKK